MTRRYSLIYYYRYLCFAYGPAFTGLYGYVMDDFGTAVIPPDCYGLVDAMLFED